MTVAKELDAKIITEYIDNEVLFNRVKDMDVDYAQGHYIGKASATLLSSSCK